MNTPDIEATDGQLDKLRRLLYVKKKVPFTIDRYQDTERAARIIEARRAYADYRNVEMATVTKPVGGFEARPQTLVELAAGITDRRCS